MKHSIFAELVRISYVHNLLEVCMQSQSREVGMETTKPEIASAYLQMRAKTDNMSRFGGRMI